MTPKARSNVLIILGVLLLALGAGLAWLPAGPIVLGICAVAAGLLLVDVEAKP